MIRLTTANALWAKSNSLNLLFTHNFADNVAANKAMRQTIPAFRMSEEWMIAVDYPFAGENK